MNRITKITSYDYSIFVIWRIIQLFDKKSKRKKQAIIDIRDLNKIIKSNNYSMQLQFDIISIVQNCLYIIIVNYNEFFYQWRIRVNDKSKLIVVLYRDNEHFNVIVMIFSRVSRFCTSLCERYCYIQQNVEKTHSIFDNYFRVVY